METRNSKLRVWVTAMIMLGFCALLWAGSLEPPFPPIVGTMKPLDHVQPRIPIQYLPETVDAVYVIYEPGSYYLLGDVQVNDPNRDCIHVLSNDVTIDLMGFKISGIDAGNGDGIEILGYTNVEIRNGTVRDFGGSGIYDGHCCIDGPRIINIRAMSNGRNGIELHSSSNLIKDCHACDNGSTGIVSALAGWSCIVTGNIANRNGGGGIYVGSGSGHNVTGNTAFENTGNGITVSDSCTVTGNSVYNNVGSGIAASGACTITGNTAMYNNSFGTAGNGGIVVGNSCIVKGNTLQENYLNNILATSSGNAIEENLVTYSAIGINLGTNPANFFANNRASGNTTNYANTAGHLDGGGNVAY